MCFMGLVFNYLLALILFYILIITLWLFFICITICIVALGDCLNIECNIDTIYYYYFIFDIFPTKSKKKYKTELPLTINCFEYLFMYKNILQYFHKKK